MIFNCRFVASSVDNFFATVAARRDTTTVAYGVEKPYFVPQMFSSFVFLSAISIFLWSLGSANVRHVH